MPESEMQGEAMKKTWKKPKLVVLYRCKPEESVLAICKADISGSMGPAKSRCRAPTGPGPCSVLGPS
jgi:hypothetical protein